MSMVLASNVGAGVVRGLFSSSISVPGTAYVFGLLVLSGIRCVAICLL